ncbi:MAG: dihydropteroate synthase [Pirellulaceae bacterium]|nr:dihydropteroate synthase [Pirellulaceae bacterium]
MTDLPPNSPLPFADASLELRFPQRARTWQLRDQTLAFERSPRLMGIVNVTPDSFSDGGLYQALSAAVDQALKLADEGADILDIGGESTRPYAEVVDTAEEIRRVIPVIERICKQARVPVSIDTSKAEVAARALDAGAQIINDVTGLEGDSEMLPLAVNSQVGVCAMHMQGRPQTMQDSPQYGNVVEDIEAYLKQRRDHLQAAGLEPRRICLDPGIGFGKSHQHNLTLMAQCGTFHRLGCPVLVGHSRKGFLGKLLEDKEADRTFATVGAALALARQGIQVIRVHDVRPAKEALLLFEATGGVDGCERQLDQC